MPSWYVASGPGVDGPAPDDDRGLLLTTNRADLLEHSAWIARETLATSLATGAELALVRA